MILKLIIKIKLLKVLKFEKKNVKIYIKIDSRATYLIKEWVKLAVYKGIVFQIIHNKI